MSIKSSMLPGGALDIPPATYLAQAQADASSRYARVMSQLDVFGHSYTTNGASAPPYLWQNCLARILGIGVGSVAAITGVTNASGIITYTATNNFAAGQIVNITGVVCSPASPNGYNIADVIASATSTTFTIAAPGTGTYASGGTARLVSGLTNYGVSGSQLCKGNGLGQGGYAATLQAISPTGTRDLSFVAYSPNLGMTAFITGLNDAGDAVTGNGANIAALVPAWKHAMRTVISRTQVSSLYESPDATYITLGGTGWATFGSTNQNSGPGYSQSSSTGVTVTIAVPSGWLGGTLVLGFVTNRVGGATPASTVTLTVDSTPTAPVGFGSATFSTDQVNLVATGTQGGLVARLPLTAGAHTVVATGSAGGLAFDYLAVEANTPRPVLFANIAKTPASTSTTRTSIDALNAATQTVLAEFGTWAVYVDIDSLLGLNNAYFADQTHPNDIGHALIAQAMATAINGLSLTTRAYL